MLRFEPVAFHDDTDAHYGAVIVTSANALRGIEQHLAGSRLLELPLFAVGEHTASAARRAGFDPRDLGERRCRQPCAIACSQASRRKQLKKASTLLYLAGADLARDLAGELGERGFTRRHADDLPDDAGGGACRARSATLSPPIGSRRCCIIRGAARARSWRRRAPPASKSRRWRSRNAAFRTAWPPIVRDAGATQVMVAAVAGRKCLVRGVGPCFAPGIALRRR